MRHIPRPPVKVKSCPLQPLPGQFPRKGGSDSTSSRLAATTAFPSPAQRGKVPKAEGGRPLILILILILKLQSKIKSAPFSPFRAASPALRGKRRHEFQIAATTAFPSPVQRGKVGRQTRKGAGF